MNIIGFSHHYTKMHGQTYGKLIDAEPGVLITPATQMDTIRYDCEYEGGAGFYRIEPGYYTRLVFIGEKSIPFTTYRTACYNPVIFGQWFVFKFKNEPLTKELVESLPWSVREPMPSVDARIFETLTFGEKDNDFEKDAKEAAESVKKILRRTNSELAKPHRYKLF